MAERAVAEVSRWMAPSEAGAALGVSADTIARWVRAGKLAGEMTPRGVLVDRADVERLRQQREAGPEGTVPHG